MNLQFEFQASVSLNLRLVTYNPQFRFNLFFVPSAALCRHLAYPVN